MRLEENSALGMGVFLASEVVFFVMLILAYVIYHRTQAAGTAAAAVLDVPRTAVFSVFLLSSSATVWRASAALSRGRRRRGALWLLATIVLGVVFLVGQGIEYAGLLQRDVTISRDLFGTTFFTLTGFHGLHVFIGIVMLSVLAGLAFFGRRREPASGAVEAISLYWHFVDVVWIAIFSVVYLWALL